MQNCFEILRKGTQKSGKLKMLTCGTLSRPQTRNLQNGRNILRKVTRAFCNVPS